MLVLAIGVGSWLIVTDLNRQLTLARQKTDFVSNVSHELKTPLTSIRMFSELLAEGRVADPAKQRSYLNIITAEDRAADAADQQRARFRPHGTRGKEIQFRHDCDLAAVVRDTAGLLPAASGKQLVSTSNANSRTGPLPVRGDGDALAQVMVNLLSNAEKYSNGQKEIAVQVARREGPLPCAEVESPGSRTRACRAAARKRFSRSSIARTIR